MSTLKVNNLQVGQDSTATNNLTWFQPGTPDGSIRLGSGNAGSATTKFTFDKDGNLTCVGNINAASILAPIEGTLDDWIVHAGDTNTKFGFSANDTFQVQTGGSARLTVTDKVGVGIAAPTAKFEVQNGANIEVLRLKDTHFNKYLTIRGGGSPNRMVIDSYEGGGGGADIDLASNGSTKVRITSSGDVTIPVDSKKFLAGAGNDVRMFHDGSDSYFDSITGNLYVYNHASGNLDLGTGGNTRFRIGSAGQLGIGGATYGSSGQVLTSQGSGAAPQWATAAGGGKILQVVQEHRTDVWSESVAQGAKSGAAITKAITTSASNSKVLVTISLTIGWDDQTGRTGVVLKRGGTEIALSDSTGDNKVRLLTCSEMNNSQWCEPIAFTYLDSPGSAATHTYTIHLWHGYQDTFTAYLNRAGYETNHNYRGRGTSSITLMEVSA